MSDYIENTKINLCDTCKQTFPECPAVGDDITFGDGIGNDNVCKCRFYEAEEVAQPNLQLTCNQLATDYISRQAAIDALSHMMDTDGFRDGWAVSRANVDCMLRSLPSAQPETAKRIVGKSRDGMTLWYQCDTCNEPVDAQDNFCRGCGRRLIDE